MAVDIGPKIGIDGEKEFRRELGQINQQIKTLGSELKQAASAAELAGDADRDLTQQKKLLERQIASQEKKLEQLNRGLAESAKKYGENDQKTQRWAQAVADAGTDLNKMKSQLNSVTREMDGLGDEVDDSADSFGSFVEKLTSGGGLGTILTKGFAVGAVVGGIKELGSALMGVVTETQEYRKIMASLEISSENAGYTAEQTAATYTQLYGVLGDQQTAATATANLQALHLCQKQLTEVTDAAIGAWATYGDSIPIDSLSEAINETVRVGQVTGVFADVLNWAGVSEDAFNAKLAAANSSTERANLVLDQLAKQGLTEAGRAWRENNQDIVKVNEATAKYDAAVARLGETLAPVAAGLLNFAAGAIGAVIDAFRDAIRWAKEFINWMRKAGSAPKPTGLAADSGRSVDGSHAGGLSYVPFDGYLAELHRGEMVLTAKEASAMRSNMLQGASSFMARAAETLAAGSYGQRGGQLLPVKVVAQCVMDRRVIAEQVTEYQLEMKRAGGLA